MALLTILQYPDPRLRTKATPITNLDDVRRVIDDMYETMYHARGVGLAATQVNIHQRFFTMDVSESANQPMCVINPEIITTEGIRIEEEGCLSVGGGTYDKVQRADTLRFRGMDIDGKIFEMDATGLMAKCVQHEIDHLNGKLFVDHLSRLKQERIRKKIEKLNR